MKTTLFLLLSFIIAQDSNSISIEAIEAIQDYENLIYKFPDMKGLNYNLANIHSQTGDVESAMRQYKQTLSSDNSELRAHALYNMGNLEFKNGNIEESSKLFREALKLSSEDKDILHNYLYSQKILEQQKQDKEDQNNKENQQKEDEQNSNQKQDDKNQENQDSSEKENNENQKIEESESNAEENSQDQEKQDQNSEKEEKQKESMKPDEQKNEDKKGQKTQTESKKLTEEEKRNLQEAEAILNALKADKDNLKKKKYKLKGRIKLEKDW